MNFNLCAGENIIGPISDVQHVLEEDYEDLEDLNEDDFLDEDEDFDMDDWDEVEEFIAMLDEEDQDLIDTDEFMEGIDDYEKEWLLDQLAEYRQEMDNDFDRRRMSTTLRRLALEKSKLYRESK